MTIDWIIRVGDGNNFIKASKFNTWCIKEHGSNNIHFLKTVVSGDRLWFVRNGKNGQIIAVASFVSQRKRELGPLIPITQTNEEFGFNGNGDWDTEIHYNNLYNLIEINLFSEIRGHCPIRKDNENIAINFQQEYENIEKYSKIKNTM